MSFEANRGQSDRSVKFLSRGDRYGLFLTSSEAVLVLPSPRGHQDPAAPLVVEPRSPIEDPRATVVRMQVRGANPQPLVTGEDELPGKVNYFIGRDPSQWRTNVSTYAKVRYSGLYPGIDLLYYGNDRHLEYDFILAPRANPRAIRLAFSGTVQATIDRDGDLVLVTERGREEVRFRKPVAYQYVRGSRREVAVQYALPAAHDVSFEVGSYDTGEPLVIDPILIYSTYLGGSSVDAGNSIAVDGSGNAYVTGYTVSANFPTANPLQASHGGGGDVFVSKLNAAGSALLYSTYLGGDELDQGTGIAVDALGQAYITGFTGSTNFPTVNPLQPTLSGGTCGQPCSDAFVAKLNATGSALLYSTYLGGDGNTFGDQGRGIAVDGFGNAYVTGWTDSPSFPTANPLQAAHGGGQDAFVSKLNPTGSALLYSTYLGGVGLDQGLAIAVDGAGQAYVTGYTGSSNFPVANALQPAFAGSLDVFVSKLDSTGSALLYSTLLGGVDIDRGRAIAVDGAGNAYVAGETLSHGGPEPTAFVSKLNPAGSALLYSALLGGTTFGYGIAVDGSGQAYVTGVSVPADRSDAFVWKLDVAGSALDYTVLGGSSSDAGYGIAVDGSGNAYVTGSTTSTNFPTANSLQPYGGGGDAFITKIADSLGARSTLTSIRPRSAPRGTSVSVNLIGTNFVTGSTTVAVSGPGIVVGPVNVVSTTSLTMELTIASSATPGVRNVTVTTPGGTTIDGLIFYVRE